MKTATNENKSQIKKWNQFLMTNRNKSTKEMKIEEEGKKREKKDYETSSQSKSKYARQCYFEKNYNLFPSMICTHGILKRKFFDFE